MTLNKANTSTQAHRSPHETTFKFTTSVFFIWICSKFHTQYQAPKNDRFSSSTSMNYLKAMKCWTMPLIQIYFKMLWILSFSGYFCVVLLIKKWINNHHENITSVVEVTKCLIPDLKRPTGRQRQAEGKSTIWIQTNITLQLLNKLTLNFMCTLLVPIG